MSRPPFIRTEYDISDKYPPMDVGVNELRDMYANAQQLIKTLKKNERDLSAAIKAFEKNPTTGNMHEMFELNNS